MYHITDKKLEGSELLFEPRIPESKMMNENKEIPRICFSNTIQGALDSIRGHRLEEMMKHCKNLGREIILHVYSPKIVNPSSFISNEKIIKNKYVKDASYTGECWITEKVWLKHIKTIEISNEICDRYMCHGNYIWEPFGDFSVLEFVKIKWKDYITIIEKKEEEVS